MPKWPDDWLGWLILVGSIAGILSAIRLFIVSRRLTTSQALLLAGAYSDVAKSLQVHEYGDAGVVIAITKVSGEYTSLKAGRIEEGIDEKTKSTIFNEKSLATSQVNRIYLDELVLKGYFIRSGEHRYKLTAKGVRYVNLQLSATHCLNF